MTFYIGVTANIEQRIADHKSLKIPGFSSRYRLTKCVLIENFYDIETAIEREKQIKNWHRDWKINLITETNPGFDDLFE